MRDNWQKYLDVQVPRYTSYPSALEFTTDIGLDAYSAALEQISPGEPLSLYVHVPFCKKLCWYCGCNMRVENRAERMSAYVDTLVDEIALVGARLGARGVLSQVHFGGGTPNTLAARDLARIMVAIDDAFRVQSDVPIAMEIDPRLCKGDQISNLVRLGVTRFSIGVQDFDPRVQEAINRVQPFDLVQETVAELRNADVPDVSLDLLYGLPYQTLCTFRRTIEQVLDLAPDRISLFGYAHMPSKLRHQRLIDSDVLPGRALRHLLAETAALRLQEAGYRRIGFDHFALPGTPIAEAAASRQLNRNFQGFTEDPSDVVIGVGSSAISTVHGTIVQNCKSLTPYRDMVSCGDLPVERGLIATLEEEEIGAWLKRLLCDMRADVSAYFELRGADGEEAERVFGRLEPLIADGIVGVEGGEIVIAEDAQALARVVAAAFDPYVHDQATFASPAV